MRSCLALITGLAIAACGLAAVPNPAAAQTAAPAILTVTGHAAGGAPASMQFDRAAIERLPQVEIVTSTPWSDKPARFEGPRLRDVLAAAGVKGQTLSAAALDDYKIQLPVADAEKYDVLVAVKRDGGYMPVRDKGPLWIIYPIDQHPELHTPETRAKMIWQLKSIAVD